MAKKATSLLDLIAHKNPVLENIIKTIPIDLVVFSPDHKYLYVANSAIKNAELREWIIGKDDFDYCRFRNRPLDMAEKRRAIFDKALYGKKPSSMEEEFFVDGKRVFYLRMFYPILDDANEVEYIVGYGYDTTVLRESKNLIELQSVAIETARDGIAVLDKDGKYFYLNESHVKLFGYEKASELIGKSWQSIYDAEEVERIEKEVFPMLVQGHWQVETVGRSRTGEPVYQEITLTTMPDGGMICICRDISQLRKQLYELKKLALVVENSNRVVIITDKDQKIEWVNPAFTGLTGYSAAEAEGRHPGKLLQGKDSDPVARKYMAACIAKGEPFECEVLNYMKNGSTYWVKIQGKALYNDAGKVEKFFAIQENITEKRQMEQELVLAKNAAEASAITKRRFLANMSHEIRTPINAIIGLSEQLNKANLTQDQQYLAEIIHTSANNLLVVLNDILDLSKIEEGKLHIVTEPMDISEVCNRAIKVLQHKAEEKNLILSLTIDECITKWLAGDPYRLNQVLLNIIGNAIKFTERGFVKLTCSVKSMDLVQQEIEIRVEDSGIGMDEMVMQNAFIEFQQGQQGFERKYGGTGLGLSICLNLVKLMKGSIKIESQPGMGTTVIVTIPFAICEAPPKEMEEENYSFLQGSKILLVEDNTFNKLVASVILKKHGVIVFEAANGKEAIQMMEEREFELVLMDIQMPVMDGINATKHIRSILNKTLPIIALTAHALDEEKQNCIASGVDDFITKPFLEAQLLQVISKWMKQKNLYA
jgi:PAS domain S-box-containing protein